MSVRIDIAYRGDLHTEAVHGPSSSVIITDAPADNHGKGEAFSPTDLVAAALGSCIITIMGIAAQQRGLNIDGTTATVVKEMAEKPGRRIRRLDVTISLPRSFAERERQILEHAAHACPVHDSLHPEVEVLVKFEYPA
ncbi:MAG: OsmC family protein [Planctomycetes bacterium]|nr:OsmC family protein [Planctomycetota bacterium]